MLKTPWHLSWGFFQCWKLELGLTLFCAKFNIKLFYYFHSRLGARDLNSSPVILEQEIDCCAPRLRAYPCHVKDIFFFIISSSNEIQNLRGDFLDTQKEIFGIKIEWKLLGFNVRTNFVCDLKTCVRIGSKRKKRANV